MDAMDIESKLSDVTVTAIPLSGNKRESSSSSSNQVKSIQSTWGNIQLITPSYDFSIDNSSTNNNRSSSYSSNYSYNNNSTPCRCNWMPWTPHPAPATRLPAMGTAVAVAIRLVCPQHPECPSTDIYWRWLRRWAERSDRVTPDRVPQPKDSSGGLSMLGYWSVSVCWRRKGLQGIRQRQSVHDDMIADQPEYKSAMVLLYYKREIRR